MIRSSLLLLLLSVFSIQVTRAVTITQPFTVPGDGTSTAELSIDPFDITFDPGTGPVTVTFSGVNTTPISGTFDMQFDASALTTVDSFSNAITDGTFGVTSLRHSAFSFMATDFAVTVANEANALDVLAVISFSNVATTFDPDNDIGSYGTRTPAAPFITNDPGVETTSDFFINFQNPTVLSGTASIDYSPAYEAALGLTDTVVNLALLDFTRSHFGTYVDHVDGAMTEEASFRLEGGDPTAPEGFDFFEAFIPTAITGLPDPLAYDYTLQTALVGADVPLTTLVAAIPEPGTHAAIASGLSLLVVLFFRRRKKA